MTIESLIKEAYFADVKVEANIGEMQKIAKALNRVASLPYNESAHDAVCGILKIASEAFDSLVSKSSTLEKVAEVRGIIDEMLDRGLISKEDVREKTAVLLKKNAHELEIVKEAMMLVGVNNQNSGIFDSETAGAINAGREMFDGLI